MDKIHFKPGKQRKLAKFLCDTLSEQLPQHLSSSQKVVLAADFVTDKKTVLLTQSSVAVEHNLCSDHEEEDTRLLLHPKHAANTHAKHAANTHPKIVTQSPDSDVSVLSEAQQKVAEYFICSIYTFTQEFSNADDARYFLFCQQSLKSEELPSTSDSLSHHIKRANFLACVGIEP